MTISGTTQTNPPDVRVPISVSDSQTPPQIVNASFTIHALPNFFKSLSYDLPLAFGDNLSFDLSSFAASPDSLGRARRQMIKLAVTGTQSWMSFNPTNFTLTGTAPSVVRDGPVPPALIQSPEDSVGTSLNSIKHERDAVIASPGTSSVTPIKIIFSALDTDAQTTSHFTLNVLLSPATGNVAEVPTDPDKDQRNNHSLNRGMVVALSVVFGLLLFALIMGLLFCSLKNGSLLAICGSFKRGLKEKPQPPYFIDQRSLDGDTLSGGHDDLEKGMVGGILKKSDGGGHAVEGNRKVSFALDTPRPSTDVEHNRGGTSISSGSHYPDDTSGAVVVPSAVKVVGRPSMDTTTSESLANGSNPYILADGTLISSSKYLNLKAFCQSRTVLVNNLLVNRSSHHQLLSDRIRAPRLVLRSIQLHRAPTIPRAVPNTLPPRTLAHHQGSSMHSPFSPRHRLPLSLRLGLRPRLSSPS